MAPTRTGLFPVYVDPPAQQASTSSLTAACSKLSLQSAASPSRPRRAAATRVLADKTIPAKENQPLAVPAALTNKTKKPSTGLGVSGRKPVREALRDVSQEFECRGSEPIGFREITPPPIVIAGAPPSKPLDIFVDPSPCVAAATTSRAPSSKQVGPAGSARPARTLTVYTSPPRKMTVVQPSSITGTVKRGRGLGGAPGLGGNVGRGLRA